MADFDKLGDLDLPQAQEASEEAQERFQERVVAAQKAMRQLKKEEGKRKKQDNHLAKIIAYFLQTTGNTDLANLIADLVEKNVPSDFILSILALVDTQSQEAVAIKKEQLLLEGKKELEKGLVTMQENLFEAMPAQTKGKINQWLENLFLIAQAETDVIMEKTLDQNLEIDPNVLQLSAYLLQRFLQKEGVMSAYQDVYEFLSFALKTIYERLQVEFAERMHLIEKN